jgi:hypothetical protein
MIAKARAKFLISEMLDTIEFEPYSENEFKGPSNTLSISRTRSRIWTMS